MSVFRELFVEVPQALLEAAVREAQTNQKLPELRRSSLGLDVVWPLLQEIGAHSGWTPISWHRSVRDCVTLLEVRTVCGCRHWLSIEESDMVLASRSAGGIVDFFWRVLGDGPQPSCSCGIPELPEGK